MSIGELVRLKRRVAGLSQRDFAARLKISAEHLCDVEYDVSEASDDVLTRVGEVGGVPIRVMAWLLGGAVPIPLHQARTVARRIVAFLETTIQ